MTHLKVFLGKEAILFPYKLNLFSFLRLANIFPSTFSTSESESTNSCNSFKPSKTSGGK